MATKKPEPLRRGVILPTPKGGWSKPDPDMEVNRTDGGDGYTTVRITLKKLGKSD